MLNNFSIKNIKSIILPAIFNSYSVVFFFNNRLFAGILMLVSFFNLYAGLSGLLAVIISVLIGYFMGVDRAQLKKGLFSFNALLTGIGMGTMFDPSYVFFSLLALASLLTLILSVTMGSWLGKYGLPVLSIPFVLTFWFIDLPYSHFENLGLTQRNIYWINELYAIGGNWLVNLFQTIDSYPLHNLVEIYLKSLSSIFFQDNILTGFLIAIAILICSRIVFSLTLVGFFSAYYFAHFSGSELASINHYNIGANYIMVAIAIGGFFSIPSLYSYLWTILLVPLTSLISFFEVSQLHIFSLPFSVVVIFFVYFLHLRINPTHLITTPIQHYNPEINLYTFENNKERLSYSLYFPLYLPFWGEWTVTQGHDGIHTHKGEWAKAFDFMILDEDDKTYTEDGRFCENYYAYNKPILAPADGYVEEIIDFIDDNEIGKVDTTNNWGNTIIIRHLPGLYTQLSHLKKHSFKVSKGQFVKKGDVIAMCGNSGRSPEPHLHFQVQATPVLGAKTLDYPVAYFHSKKNGNDEMKQFCIPSEGTKLSGILPNESLQLAFDITPNSIFEFSYTDFDGKSKTESWEAHTDAFNNKYLYCKENESSAFYFNDSSIFYFTSFYGNKKSLLYHFYLTSFKVFLGDNTNIKTMDAMPINILGKKIYLFFHDFIAPFYCFVKAKYEMKMETMESAFETKNILLKSQISISVLGKNQVDSTSKIYIKDNKIGGFSFTKNNKSIVAKCINS
jgi:urea transporter/murein DD-endopeptidase MepM/ murein hydrolase activator NlpD